MRLLIVIVRYKTPLEDSETVASLCATLDRHPSLLAQLEVLLWDNSPQPLRDPPLPAWCRYGTAGENLGVSGAYNRAADRAREQGCDWMLLLDQDTTLREDFLPGMLAHCRELEDRQQVAAIVPFLMDGRLPSSPVAMYAGRNRVITPPFSGIHPRPVFAANSGTVLRVSALAAVGGYNEEFWLDLSDVVLFDRLAASGFKVWIAGELELEHHITNNDYDASMSPQRYRNFIAAEGAYWDLYRSPADRAVYAARLLGRVWRQRRRYRNREYSRISLRYFWRRMFTRRERRLEEWRRQSRQRDLPAVAGGRVVG